MKSSFLPTALLVCAINSQTFTSGTGVPVSSTQVTEYNESGDTSSSRSVAGTTPRSPPSGPATGPATGSSNGLRRESNFLAIGSGWRLELWA